MPRPDREPETAVDAASSAAVPGSPAGAPPSPAGYVVLVPPGDRIHFVDWGGSGTPAVLLVHGLAGSAALWAPVARRLRATHRVVAMDLRGHGLSDAPTEPGSYDLDVLGEDVVAVAEGSGALDATTSRGIVLVGHGFGAIVCAVAAARLGSRCVRLVLVDGGLDDVAERSGQDVEEFLRGLDEPPEVMRSMTAFLADRRAWDPATWDADQEAAARAAVVETPAGRLVPATRPHALEACVRSMFAYRPEDVLDRVTAPVVVVGRRTAGEESDDSEDSVVSAPPGSARGTTNDAVVSGPIARSRVTTIELEAPGHNLMRYRPDAVTAAILAD